ncbi:hypothetical protein LguiB_023579 [Lonicera macranthoides]
MLEKVQELRKTHEISINRFLKKILVHFPKFALLRVTYYLRPLIAARVVRFRSYLTEFN